MYTVSRKYIYRKSKYLMPIPIYNIWTRIINFGTWYYDIACKVQCILRKCLFAFFM